MKGSRISGIQEKSSVTTGIQMPGSRNTVIQMPGSGTTGIKKKGSGTAGIHRIKIPRILMRKRPRGSKVSFMIQKKGLGFRRGTLGFRKEPRDSDDMGPQ